MSSLLTGQHHNKGTSFSSEPKLAPALIMQEMRMRRKEEQRRAGTGAEGALEQSSTAGRFCPDRQIIATLDRI